MLDRLESQMPIIITRKQEINKSPIVNGQINDVVSIAAYNLTGLYFSMPFLISIITLRILIPRGQTNMHLPQSIHFFISDSSSTVSPRRNKRFILRTLKLTRSLALHVAVQPPHERQTLNDGSFCKTSFSSRPSN